MSYSNGSSPKAASVITSKAPPQPSALATAPLATHDLVETTAMNGAAQRNESDGKETAKSMADAPVQTEH